MKKVIKQIIVLVLYYSGLNWLVGQFLSSKVFCVGYHSVWDEKNKTDLMQSLYWNISVNREDFEKQLLFLKNNGHTFIHFGDLKKPETRKLSKPTVIFFDDGFKDVLQNALPVLQKHSIPATVFITTGLIEKTDFLWTLGVRHILLTKSLSHDLIEGKVIELKKLFMPDREKKISEMQKDDNFTLNPLDFNVFLSWDEVRQLSQNNFEIASHGVRHEKLTELNDPELKRELADSKAILETKTGLKIEGLSYPYGRHNERVIQFAKSGGYSFGLSTLLGSNSFSYIQSSPFQIKRINPEESKTFMDFKVRLYTNL